LNPEGINIILHIVGARPQFIKLAPVVQAFQDLGIPYKVLHTGQHYDYTMSNLHFDSLGLQAPDYHLGIASDSHARQTALMLQGIEDVLIKETPKMVLVYGDTNSTLAGALAAVKLGMRVGHVEAGVRSYDRTMPEEINRIVADHVSDHHFCPTRNAVNILKTEGIEGVLTGDVMYDALLRVREEDLKHPYTGDYVLVTIHRAENTNNTEKFLAIWEALKRISQRIPVIFPVHPRTRNKFARVLADTGSHIEVIDPVSYFTMLAMIRDTRCMITDSGGVQKEAFLLGVPCVTVRDTTEWPETVHSGANRLVATDPDTILNAVLTMMDMKVINTDNPFGDGQASRKIAEFIKDHCL
jgi:UDP-N-acetylglucosamine 2-epimerase